MSFSVLFGYYGDDGPRDRLFGWVLKWWRANFPEAQVCMGRNFDEPFHRGRARNDAALNARRDVLVIADADTIPDAAAVAAAVQAVTDREAPWVLPYAENSYFNLSESSTQWVLGCNPATTTIPAPTNPEAFEHQITSWAGCLVVPRVAFEAVGGYDERFTGWGYEDNAFRIALDTIVGKHQRLAAHCCHLWHPVTAELTWDQPFITENRTLYRRYERAQGDAGLMREVLSR